jgi:hypothetical protein
MRRTIYTDLESLGHDEDFAPKPCSEPTSAMPGSREKIAVLRLRVERGECLWHPLDDSTPAEPRGDRWDYVAGLRVVVELGSIAKKEKPV